MTVACKYNRTQHHVYFINPKLWLRWNLQTTKQSGYITATFIAKRVSENLIPLHPNECAHVQHHNNARGRYTPQLGV